ncbi:MAG: hypothetical protein J3R72DRAFT_514525 [Linnemannia gamsii]|nr:MAG: hypothetical protein J3R72DRAFT_514525 [Linnemannia gamsii]
MLSSKSEKPFPGSRTATPNGTQPEPAHFSGSTTSLLETARKIVFSIFSKKKDEKEFSAIAAAIAGIEDDLIKLKNHRLEVQENALYIPPQAKPNLQSSDDTLFPLKEKALEFLAGPCQVFLILGDSGGGKSTFNLQLEHTLWNTYKRGNPIPLLINLPSIDNPQQDIIGKQLRRLDFSDTQIMEIKQNRQLIVICDGYDESQLTTNLHTTNAFNQPG